MNTKPFVNHDAVPLREFCGARHRQRRRSSVVDSVEKFLGRRRSSIGQFLERRRDTIIERVFGPAEEENVESAEWLEMRRRLRQVEGKLTQRSNQQCRARVRCVDGTDDDEIPYELMGQVLVLTLLATVILFAWIAEEEGLTPTRI